MANSFGGTIKLTGESEYRKALRDITSDMRLMSSEMKVLATSTDSSGKSSDADRAKKQALSKAIEEQKAKLSTLNKELEASTAESGTTSDATKRLQTQVNNATAQLNKMESQLDGTGKETGELGTEMDGTGKKASIFGEVLKANLASEAIIGGLKLMVNGMKAVGSAIGGVVKDSVTAFADYEQLIGGVETLFGDSANVVAKNAQQAYKTAGISANQYMEQATSFSATLLQGLDGDTAKASEYANKAITDMSDNANKMGTDIGLIQNAYQGFAKDNYTMLDNLKLGYGGTASEMARLVNDSGVMGDSFKATAENVKDIPFDKLIDAIHKTQKEMGITGTTAKEASETISGALNSTKSAWENVLSSLASGNDEQLKEAIDGLVESAGNLATNVMAIIPNIVEGIAQLTATLIEQIPTIVTNLLPTLINSAMTLINSIVTIIPQLIPVIGQVMNALVQAVITNLPMILQAGIDILLGLINGITQSIPKLIPVIIEAINIIVKGILDNLPAIIKAGIEVLVALIKGLADALPQLIGMLPTIITTIVKVLTEPSMIDLLIKASLQIMLALAKGIIGSIGEIVKAVPQIISAFVGGIGGAIGGIVSAGGDLVKGLWRGISDATGWILDKIKGFGTSVLNGIKSFFGIKSPSRLFKDEVGKNLALGVGEGFTDNMDNVVEDMKDALPSSLDTDIELNNSARLASAVSDSSALSSAFTQDSMVSAIQEAFKTVKIELDDKKVGDFVIGTVEGAIY